LHLQRANALPTPPFTALIALLEILVASWPLKHVQGPAAGTFFMLTMQSPPLYTTGGRIGSVVSFGVSSIGGSEVSTVGGDITIGVSTVGVPSLPTIGVKTVGVSIAMGVVVIMVEPSGV
jgi:hypothetical protein